MRVGRSLTSRASLFWRSFAAFIASVVRGEGVHKHILVKRVNATAFFSAPVVLNVARGRLKSGRVIKFNKKCFILFANGNRRQRGKAANAVSQPSLHALHDSWLQAWRTFLINYSVEMTLENVRKLRYKESRKITQD